jgi:hypothetical protein
MTQNKIATENEAHWSKMKSITDVRYYEIYFNYFLICKCVDAEIYSSHFMNDCFRKCVIDDQQTDTSNWGYLLSI